MKVLHDGVKNIPINSFIILQVIIVDNQNIKWQTELYYVGLEQ